jgi:RNA polymerase sigma-70 factor, ECF subfamily
LSSSNAAGLPALLPRFGRLTVGVTDRTVVHAETAQYQSCPDEDLLVLVQSGDRDALGVLFDRYARLILSVGLRVIRDSAEAEDLVHDVFLFIVHRKSLFDPSKGSARVWLARTTHHRALDRRKYLLRRSFYDKDKADSCFEAETSNGADHPEFLYWQSYLKRIFDDLSEDQRATLELHFFEGLTISEIGEKLGKSPANIRNYYYRGLERLRSFMAQQNGSGRERTLDTKL